WIRNSEDFELVTEPPFNTVCFRHKAGDKFNMKLMNSINESGKAFFTHTKLNNQVVLRLVVGQTNTEEQHVKKVWELIQGIAKNI
ncbi:MAG: hypothetical protein JW833_04275, partial [Prolixibacteraceae bacterium]|nr:hypothetical protein [Prolixibacteraceae bacterium]